LTKVRLAVSGVFIDPVVTDGKARIAQQLIIQTGCGARHVVSWSAPFVLTGEVTFDTVTTESIKDWIKKYRDGEIRSLYIDANIIARRKFKHGEVILYKRTDESYPKPRALINGYLVFDVVGSKAVLVDEEPEKMLLIVIHKVYSKTKDSKIVANFPFVFKDVTSCARQSNALAVALIDPKPAKKNIYCLNDPPFRYEREERYSCYTVDISGEEYIGTFTDPKLAFEL
jgi:hypothetical protein